MNPTPHAPGSCRVCGGSGLLDRIDFGPQPVCNRYLAQADAPERRFPRRLDQCPHCGILQIADPVPAMDLRPTVDWIRYDEAEGHLDDLTERIIETAALRPEDLVVGLCYKDASTLARLNRRGFPRTALVEVAADLGETSPCAGVETFETNFTETRAAAIARKHGRARVLLVRHVFEHVHDMPAFARAVKTLLEPDGFLVVEVPDFTLVESLCDYCTIWEEHTVFLKPATLRIALATLGFETVTPLDYPYPLENAIVAIARPTAAAGTPDAGTVADALQAGARYAAAHPKVCASTRRMLAEARKRGPVAMFGAGHLACDFINLQGVADLFDFVVDDHPKKNGLFLPGSRLPIVGSAALRERKAALCLLSLKPESEPVVLARQQAYVDAGGVFASIYPRGPLSLRHRMEDLVL